MSNQYKIDICKHKSVINEDEHQHMFNMEKHKTNRCLPLDHLVMKYNAHDYILTFSGNIFFHSVWSLRKT